MPRPYVADDDRADSNRQTASLAGMAVMLAIVVVCVFLMKELQAKAAVEDCLLFGGRDCDSLLMLHR